MSRFCGPRTMKWSGDGSLVTMLPSRPGRASSIAVGVSMLLVDPPFLGDLARREPGKRAGRHILRDDGPWRNPCVVPNIDGREKRIVDAGPDVAADRRPLLRLARDVAEVRSDVAGGDVRVLADLRVADVREVRDLRARPDAYRLELDER